MFIERKLVHELKKSFELYPVVTVMGPRQSGKSTLVRSAFPNVPYVNLELTNQLDIIKADPVAFLQQYKDGAIIDEVQNYPGLLSYIQVYVDEQKRSGMFILTGSHQFSLHEDISQSLAGRTAVLSLLPLSMAELRQHEKKPQELESLILKGFYPRCYERAIEPYRFYEDYLRTYVERDVRKLVNIKDAALFRDFIKLCASRVGQILNQQNIANELGISNTTINQWLSILEASFVIVRLKPYFENLGKRIIKSPKLYFVDVGLAAYLNNIDSVEQLQRDSLKGALIENLVVSELMKIRYNQGRSADFYFFRDNHQNEVDIIYKYGNELIPIEIKGNCTFNERFLKGLRYFNALDPERVRTGYLLYQGDIEQKIKNFHLLNIQNLEQIFINTHAD